MTESQIVERNKKLIDLLYPSIRLSTDAYNQQMMDDFSLKHRILKDGAYPPGSVVMKYVDEKGDKGQPNFEGPFKVLSQTSSRNYVLLDNTGLLYPRNVPPSQLKLVNVPDYLLEEDESYEVDFIVRHRGDHTSREYLVKWKNYPHSSNTWTKAKDFESTGCINDYWKKHPTTHASKRGRKK